MARRLRILLSHMRNLVWAVMDGVVIRLIRPAASQSRMLIIRPDAIGDFVLWLNAGRELCAHSQKQGYSVVLIGNAVLANGRVILDWATKCGLWIRIAFYTTCGIGGAGLGACVGQDLQRLFIPSIPVFFSLVMPWYGRLTRRNASHLRGITVTPPSGKSTGATDGIHD